MKKINLRDYYPFYTTDTIVEVPDEVADLLHEYKLNEAAYILRTSSCGKLASSAQSAGVFSTSGSKSLS